MKAYFECYEKGNVIKIVGEATRRLSAASR
jgi:hypothetical protein